MATLIPPLIIPIPAILLPRENPAPIDLCTECQERIKISRGLKPSGRGGGSQTPSRADFLWADPPLRNPNPAVNCLLPLSETLPSSTYPLVDAFCLCFLVLSAVASSELCPFPGPSTFLISSFTSSIYRSFPPIHDLFSPFPSSLLLSLSSLNRSLFSSPSAQYKLHQDAERQSPSRESSTKEI